MTRGDVTLEELAAQVRELLDLSQQASIKAERLSAAMDAINAKLTNVREEYYHCVEAMRLADLTYKEVERALKMYFPADPNAFVDAIVRKVEARIREAALRG